mgnify:CR=1 FL=1
MTTPPTPEAHLLVILGEVRGDVKGVLRSQQEFSKRLDALEAHFTSRITKVEQEVDDRLVGIEKRVLSLEAIRLKAAGAILALTLIASVVRDKVAPVFELIFGG